MSNTSQARMFHACARDPAWCVGWCMLEVLCLKRKPAWVRCLSWGVHQEPTQVESCSRGGGGAWNLSGARPTSPGTCPQVSHVCPSVILSGALWLWQADIPVRQALLSCRQHVCGEKQKFAQPVFFDPKFQVSPATNLHHQAISSEPASKTQHLQPRVSLPTDLQHPTYSCQPVA